jgi:hypothetical protein
MSGGHHANDGTASRIHRALIKEHGYTTHADASAVVTAAQAQAARCERGEHDEAVAEKGRVTWLAFGRRVEPGTRYCRYCSAVLPPEDAAPVAGEEQDHG